MIMTTISLININSCYTDRKKKLVMRTLRSLLTGQFANIYHTTILLITVVTMLYIISLILSNWRCVHFGHFHLIPSFYASSDNHKSDLFFIILKNLFLQNSQHPGLILCIIELPWMFERYTGMLYWLKSRICAFVSENLG